MKKKLYNERRIYRSRKWEYLLDDDEKTAWIVKGHIGRYKRFRIPDSVEIDGQSYTITCMELGAFNHPRTLRHLSIPDSIEYVDEDEFSFMPKLRNIHIGKGVKYLTDWLFRRGERSVPLFIDKRNPNIKPSNNLLLTGDGKTVLRTLTRCRKYIIPEGFETFDVQGLMDNTGLEYLDHPATLKKLKDNLCGCTSLKTLIIRTNHVFDDPHLDINDIPLVCQILVPEHLVDDYKKHPVWGKFNIRQKNTKLQQIIMNKRKILWIHGFAGCPDNMHVKEMRKRYPEYEWYSIEVDHHAKASMEKINSFIRENVVCLVAGTSLGGYYAMCSEYEGPKLVVNPVTNPVRDLKQFVGKCCYKPGRPDGQTEFEFTEEMLNEFGELHYGDLCNVVCHYTAHDQVLGEDIKKDYEQIFYILEMMDEKILPEHFMTFKYVKEMKQTLFHLIDLDILRHRNAYESLGPSYQLLPEKILQPILILHSIHKGVNYKKLLREIETCIKEEYEMDKKLRHEPWNRNEDRTRETLKTLLRDRKLVLSGMFTLSQESFDAFKSINDNLLEMYNRMVDKMARLYSSWLTDEEDGWQNDCNVCGKILVEQTKEGYPKDETGSDYEWMAERIEDLESNEILNVEFSGAPDICCDRHQLGLEYDSPNVYFSLGGAKPYGDFLTCRAFRELELESLYAPQDILRLKYYWCDVYLTHQRITNDKGELQ